MCRASSAVIVVTLIKAVVSSGDAFYIRKNGKKWGEMDGHLQRRGKFLNGTARQYPCDDCI